MGPPAPVTASATQSLFATILAPPPAKRARTIHNPQDPPVPAPAKLQAPSPSQKPSKSSRSAENTTAKPKRKRARESSGAKGKGKQHPTVNSTADMDIDYAAATALTSLLLSSKASKSATASSPRSSISAGSDAGSSHSFPHFQQSSTRTVAGPASIRSEASFGMSQPRSGTPASAADSAMHLHSSNLHEEGRSTPKTGRRPMYASDHSGTPHPPTDAEAANSLLFLATSPSPVRASAARDRDSKDAAAFRTGSNLKGRVLFPTHGGGTGGGGDDASSSGGRSLRREDTGSFTSTASTTSSQFSIGSMAHIYNRYAQNRQMSGSPMNTSPNSGTPNASQLPVPKEPTVTPPTPTEPAAPTLLPAAPSPTRTDRSYASPPPASPEPQSESARAQPVRQPVDSTPGNGSFNLSDFINVSPSPAVAAGSMSRLGSMTEVGRRLFEEHHAAPGAARSSDTSASGAGGALAAGIDLSRS
ncbi:hypothetical protein EVJ58_g5226 [Rhodofomes roseus]|uniref:Uncharacterized protein n=1 Tax=Rhodofomes roseus TaxID=34475 RepID=A0A4Y9YCQ9_9APHY|nr:hypothetical protein EVJ58_g5226 [Rhodofomes roseus]